MMDRSWSKTFKQYIAAMKIAREGKTFIIVSKDFVAIDMKTWERINQERRLPYVYVDEDDLIDPDTLRRVQSELKKL